MKYMHVKETQADGKDDRVMSSYIADCGAVEVLRREDAPQLK